MIIFITLIIMIGLGILASNSNFHISSWNIFWRMSKKIFMIDPSHLCFMLCINLNMICFFFCKVSWSKDMQFFFLPKYIQRSSTHASIWVKKTSILSMFINCWPLQHFAIVDTIRKLTNKLTNSNDDVTIWIGVREIIISFCCVSYYHWNRFSLVGIYLNNLIKLCLLWFLF
jgi:hypothetical protein